MENTNIEMSEKMRRRETMRGTALTLMGGVFWGLAGVFGKYSFEHKGMTAQWLVNVRLIIAGLILLTTVYMKQKKDTFRVWKECPPYDPYDPVWRDRYCCLPDDLLYGSGRFQCGHRNSASIYGTGYDHDISVHP